MPAFPLLLFGLLLLTLYGPLGPVYGLFPLTFYTFDGLYTRLLLLPYTVGTLATPLHVCYGYVPQRYDTRTTTGLPRRLPLRIDVWLLRLPDAHLVILVWLPHTRADIALLLPTPFGLLTLAVRCLRYLYLLHCICPSLVDTHVWLPLDSWRLLRRDVLPIFLPLPVCSC